MLIYKLPVFWHLWILLYIASVNIICSLNYKYERVNFCRICLLSFLCGVANKLSVTLRMDLETKIFMSKQMNVIAQCLTQPNSWKPLPITLPLLANESKNIFTKLSNSTSVTSACCTFECSLTKRHTVSQQLFTWVMRMLAWLLINSTARSPPPFAWWLPTAVGSGVTLIPNDLHALHAAWSKAKVDGTITSKPRTFMASWYNKTCQLTHKVLKMLASFRQRRSCSYKSSILVMHGMARKVAFSEDSSALQPQNPKSKEMRDVELWESSAAECLSCLALNETQSSHHSSNGSWVRLCFSICCLEGSAGLFWTWISRWDSDFNCVSTERAAISSCVLTKFWSLCRLIFLDPRTLKPKVLQAVLMTLSVQLMPIDHHRSIWRCCNNTIIRTWLITTCTWWVTMTLLWNCWDRKAIEIIISIICW